MKVLFKIPDPLKKKAVYNKKITRRQEYLETVYKVTKKLLDEGHTVLIIGFTVDQVQTISEYLQNNGIQNRRVYSKERDFDYDNDRCIVATYQYAGTAFDFDKLSAAVLACPLGGKKSIIQTCGRILRKKPKGCEIDPVFVHLVDLDNFHLFVEDVKRAKAIVENEFGIKATELKL